MVSFKSLRSGRRGRKFKSCHSDHLFGFTGQLLANFKDNTTLPDKPPSHRWNRLEVLRLRVFTRSHLLNALKALNCVLQPPSSNNPAGRYNKMVRLPVYSLASSGYGWNGSFPHYQDFNFGSPANRGPHIFRRAKTHLTGIWPETVFQKIGVIILLRRALDVHRLARYVNKPWLTWSHRYAPSMQQQ